MSLLEKYNIPLEKIGRLEIGTETLIDKSKSTKTVLMELFQSVGNHDIEGVTVVNACYGGTAALLNALTWADSSAWDGRYAIVVAGDIAVYAPGPARPTCGCGAVAMLIGRDAPLEVDLFTRTTHASHQWDFFKPNPHSEYPVVNGKFSQKCYLTAFDSCYSRFLQKSQAKHAASGSTEQPLLSSDSIDFMLFHSPYNKLVQKSVQRIFYLDYLAGHLPSSASSSAAAELEPWKDTPLDQTYTDRGLENALKTLAEDLYQSKVAPSCHLSKQVGNTYTAAVYLNLANLVSLYGGTLIGKTVTLFSYGSGAMASMFRIIPRQPSNPGSVEGAEGFSLDKMQEVLRVSERLATRGEKYTPEEFEAALAAREKSHGTAPFLPTYPVSSVPKGTFYLSQITADFERHYLRRPLGDESPDTRGPADASPAADAGL
jgi:hydroxymethylglutaryl-CoA synthase